MNKNHLIAVLGVTGLCYALADEPAEPKEPIQPHVAHGGGPVDIPMPWRQKNWTVNGSGSCVHASAVMAMRWLDQHGMAEWWRQNHGAGEYASRLSKKLTEAGVPHAISTNGSTEILEACTRTRRPAVIGYGNSHSQLFCGFDGQVAWVLDNNHIEQPYAVQKEEFIRRWRGWGGWAVVILGDPPSHPIYVHPERK